MTYKDKLLAVVLASLVWIMILDWRQSVDAQMSQMIGIQANLWNATVVTPGAVSAVFDTRGFPNCSVFGNVTATSTLTLQASADNINYYSTELTTLSNTDFGTHIIFGAKFIRMTTDTAATITATVQCKL
jgi:hypothetical protein